MVLSTVAHIRACKALYINTATLQSIRSRTRSHVKAGNGVGDVVRGSHVVDQPPHSIPTVDDVLIKQGYQSVQRFRSPSWIAPR